MSKYTMYQETKTRGQLARMILLLLCV